MEFNAEIDQFMFTVKAIDSSSSLETSDFSLHGRQKSVVAVQFRFQTRHKFWIRSSHDDTSSDTLINEDVSIEFEEGSRELDMDNFSSSSCSLIEILSRNLSQRFNQDFPPANFDPIGIGIATLGSFLLSKCPAGHGLVNKVTLEVCIQRELDMVLCEECVATSRSVAMEELEAENRLVPASESSIKKLKRIRIAEDNEEDQDKKRRIKFKGSKKESGNVSVKASDCCSICLDEFISVGKYAAQTPCSHAFHDECIEAWLRRSHYCPLCRFEMPTADDEIRSLTDRSTDSLVEDDDLDCW